MLIKLYDSMPSNDLHIIEGVSGVTVHSGTFLKRNNGPCEVIGMEYDYQPSASEETEVRYISFNNMDGILTRLRVYNLAYVCNDQGKTIETVRV
jgi:hypothetical protein